MKDSFLEEGHGDESSEASEPPGSPSSYISSWWERTDLQYRSGVLYFGETSLSALSDQAGDLPAYVYRPARILEKATMIRAAVPGTTLYYAVKANRHPAILRKMLETVDGIDVCSPNEAKLALEFSFREEQISYTGTSLSDADIRFLAEHPSIHVNVDSLSCLRRLAPQCPGRTLGIRINPEAGIGYRNEPKLVYSIQQRPGKFGLLAEQLPEALKIAEQFGCRINTVHWHVGCGWLDEQLDGLAAILATAATLASRLPDIERINLGGGLGIPLRSDDAALSLKRWSEIVQQTVGTYWKICLEPGSFLIQDAGILLVRVNTVETKRQWTFAGVNAGFNLAMEPVFYGMRLEPVFLKRPRPDQKSKPVTIAGNINEAHDLFVQDFEMPVPREGEPLGFLNAGAYAASMSSNHCLRGEFLEFVVP